MLSFSENLHTRDDELVEGDMKLLPGQTRGSVASRLWPKGEFVYEIESSLSKLIFPRKSLNKFFLLYFKVTCFLR